MGRAADFRRQLLTLGVEDIGDDHGRTLGHEQTCHSGADPSGSTSDDRHPIVETSRHDPLNPYLDGDP